MKSCACLVGVLAVLSVTPLLPRAAADTFGSGANSFEIEFVAIGNPGNPPDMTGQPRPAGSVPYAYRIGKYEISEQMIDNANAVGGLGITKDTRGPDKPATSVSWFEAARFVNWLNTSTGNTPAYKFDGGGTFQLWMPSDTGYDANNPLRNSRAKYYLPGVHEWYKAAYYDPASGAYFDYPTGSNTVPDGIDVPGDTVFDAVFNDQGQNPQPNDITNVGALSPYATAGQGGNVWEWNEADFVQSNDLGFVSRGVRGGAWNKRSIELLSTMFLYHADASSEFSNYGFRVASVVPEPTTAVMLGSALLAGLRLRRRATSPIKG